MSMPHAEKKRGIVIGGSVAGHLASRVLSDHFEQVSLIERDVLPTQVQQRRGVPQGCHTHGLLASGRNDLERLFPGISEPLVKSRSCSPRHRVRFPLVFRGREGGREHARSAGYQGLRARVASAQDPNQISLRGIGDRSCWGACLTLWGALLVAISLFPASLHAQFVYVANDESDNVSAYTIGANGALTPVPGSPFAAGGVPDSVAVDPTAKFAYVANLGNNVSAYSIGANGALTPVPGSPFAPGTQPSPSRLPGPTWF